MGRRALLFAATAASSGSSVLGFLTNSSVSLAEPTGSPVPAPSPLPTLLPTLLNITQVHLAFGHDAATSVSVAWVCNASHPLGATFAAAASLPAPAQAAFAAGTLRVGDGGGNAAGADAAAAAEAIAALGAAVGATAAPASTFARYSVDSSPWGYPVVWVGDDWDNAVPTYVWAAACILAPTCHDVQ